MGPQDGLGEQLKGDEELGSSLRMLGFGSPSVPAAPCTSARRQDLIFLGRASSTRLREAPDWKSEVLPDQTQVWLLGQGSTAEAELGGLWSLIP